MCFSPWELGLLRRPGHEADAFWGFSFSRVSLGRGRDQLWGCRSCGVRRLWRCADYDVKEQKSQGKTIDPHAPRLASVRNDTPGAGTYDPQDTKKKAPSANFGKSKAVDLPFRGASTDAIYYPDEQHANSHPSAAFTSNEPRLLPPRQAGPGDNCCSQLLDSCSQAISQAAIVEPFFMLRFDLA